MMGSSSSKHTISSEIHRIYSKQLYQRYKNNNNNNNNNNNDTKDTDICNSTNDDITDKLGIKLKQYEELEKLIRFKEKTEAINWRTKLNTHEISDKEINSVIDQLYISIESNTISTTEFLLLAYPEIKNYINNTMKCNINDKEFKLTTLMMASITGNRLALELLLQNPYVNINTTSENNNNNSALIFGVLYEQTISVETLCRNERLDINHNDCNNYNALHHAVVLENVDITRIICKRKDLSLIAQTNNGDTVLHIACRNGNQQIIDIILDAVSKQTLSASSLYNGNHLWKIVSPRIDDKSSEFSDDISESTNSIISLDSDSCLSPRASIIIRESLQNIAKIKNKKKETALSILLSMNDAHKFLSCSSPTKQQQYKKINILKEKLKRYS